MTQSDIKKIVENLIQTFLDAGKISIDLRKKGLTKEIKSDNTPVSNGDLEVNKILSKKILSLTPKQSYLEFPKLWIEMIVIISLQNLMGKLQAR